MVYIFITHDMKLVRVMSDYLIVMKSGRVVEQGKAQDVIEKPKRDYTKQLIKAGLLHVNLYQVPV